MSGIKKTVGSLFKLKMNINIFN